MSEINKLTVNGKVYDLADATAREQMHHLRRAGQLIAPVITLTDYLANPYKMVKLADGIVYDTPSAISVSDLFFCYEGDKISATLSNQSTSVIFITYDKNGNVVTSIAGEGFSKYTTFEHTFTAEECTFRIGGVDAKTAYYALNYQPKNNLFVCVASENDAWEV